MRLKIISDGTNDGTRIENAETGEPVLDVVGFEISGKIGEPYVDVTLKLINVEMEIIGDLKKKVISVGKQDLSSQVESILWKLFEDIQKRASKDLYDILA